MRTAPSLSVKLARTRTRSLSGSEVTPPQMPEWVNSGFDDAICGARHGERVTEGVREGQEAHLDGRVDDAAQAKRQARDSFAKPVRVADEDYVDVSDEVLYKRKEREYRF